MTLSDRILPRLATLSPKLQKAALYVVEHPEEVATRSLRQVARATDMSAPTFSRLAEVLDFDSYDDLRAACLSELRVQKQSYAAKAKALQDDAADDDSGGAFIVHQANATISNINALVNTVDAAAIEAAATKIAKARKVVLLGMMSSRPFVDYAAYVASMAFSNWEVYGSGAGVDAALLADIGPQDVVLAISAAPYAARTIEVAGHFKDAGAHVIAITDAYASPLCHDASAVFLVANDTPQFFTSHAATLVLLESLIGLVVRKSGPQVGDRIARVEARAHEIGTYYPIPKPIK